MPQIGTYDPVAAAATQDETLARYLRMAAALYGWDGTDLSRVLVESATNPNLRARLYGGATAIVTDAASNDAFGTNNLCLFTKTHLHLFNGGTWDRMRSNVNATILASAARTATTNSADQTNYNARGVIIYFDITAVPGVDTVQLTVEGKDPVSSTYRQLLVDTAQSATGTRVAIIYPGAGTAADQVDIVRGYPLPRTWRVTIVHSAASSFTYSVGAAYIL